ncbi:uncharacterized protein LOC143019109 [Oratosquilla oratoria]|uniref:uncharacterized protein LOC143019109 n=1 Tax=Oratosquilla oratoria TaxID=337810 RepID=UPI003F75E2BF
MEEIVGLMKERHWDLIGLSETRMRGEDVRAIHEDYLLVHKGAEDGKYGVGFIISPQLANRVKNVRPVSNCLIGLTLQMNHGYLDIIQVCAPQQKRSNNEKEKFYETLQDLVDSMPNRDNQVIMGDFNGHIGLRTSLLKDVIGPFSIGDVNPNGVYSHGERITDFCVRNGLSIMNTFFQHRSSHKWTWYKQRQKNQEYLQKSMTDLVLASRKSLIHDVKAIPSISFGSDHRVVVALVNIRYTRARPSVKRRRVAVEKLKKPEAKERMAENLHTKIMIDKDEEDIERAWESSKKAILESIEATIGFTYTGGKKKRTPFWNEETRKAVMDKNYAFREWLKERTEDSRRNYVRLRNVAKRTMRKVMRETWKRIGRDLEEDFHGTKKLLYSMAKGYRKVNKEKSFSLKDGQGNLLTKPEDVDRRWNEYFESLLNTPEEDSGMDTSDDEEENQVEDGGITTNEIMVALEHMKNNKAAGVDEIPAEIYKYGGQHIISYLTWIYNMAWKTKKIPKEWGSAVIYPVHKKGDRTSCNNYRAISLLPHAGKIYERILERRLRTYVEERLHKAQHSFRPNQGTTDLSFALKILLEKSWEFNYPRYLAFLDLGKAFDQVPRKELWKALRHVEHGIPRTLRRAICSLYESNKTTVRSIRDTTLCFNAGSGVRSGSVVSPLLIILLMYRVISSVEYIEPTKGAGEADKFAYANDVGIVEATSASLAVTVDLWNRVLQNHGLNINLQKTEVMVVSRQNELLQVEVDGITLKQTTACKYLGVMYDDKGTHEGAVQDRIQKYTVNVNFLYSLLKDKNIPVKVKTTIYKSILRPILTYGCEAWVLTTKTTLRVQAAEMRVLRMIHGVSKSNRLCNENIRRELGVESIISYIERAQLQWYGHMMRMEEHRTPRRWYHWVPNTRCPPGRPRMRWDETVDKALRKHGTSLNDVCAHETFLDRGEWMRLITDRPYGLPGGDGQNERDTDLFKYKYQIATAGENYKSKNEIQDTTFQAKLFSSTIIISNYVNISRLQPDLTFASNCVSLDLKINSDQMIS